jgi:uncharacterized integral membrane protein (TIGR00698 family)
MVRVMMLAPFLIVLSAILSRADRARALPGAPRTGSGVVVPWFALGFVAVAGLNSLARLPPPAVNAAVGMDTFLLAMAMGALGLSTRWSALRRAGIKPLALAAVLFGWLLLGGIAINGAFARLFH